ncbi:hypothetical protein F5Y10DRAFT_276275 [Nemania abortiva]|nr:hypothetical protein F5Y10DRAFT_276275 [Nemania abortiva]
MHGGAEGEIGSDNIVIIIIIIDISINNSSSCFVIISFHVDIRLNNSATPITASIPSTSQTSAPLVPPSIPSSTLPALENESSSATSTLDPTTASSSPTIDQGLASTTQTNDSSAPTPSSGASSSASLSTSQIIGAGTAAATTTTTGSGQLESSEAGPGLTNGAQNNSTGSAASTQTTVAVAGGVIGGLALISIIAFLLWFWRKRLMKKRRSTMLTPLSTTGAAYRDGEKGPYVISRNSLGPTTIPEKVRAMVGYNYHRLRGRVNSLVTRSPKPSVDMNRGNSQFGLPETPVARSASRAGAPSTEALTTKDKFVDWWGRLTEDGNLNWKLRNDAPKGGRANNDTYTSMPSTAQARKKGGQPDFLTLLSMDEKQQQRELSNNTASSGSNPRRSQSLGNEHFLGGLGLNFDTENPFADSNVMSHDSAKVMPLAVPRGEASNPFSDANAIPGQSRPANNSNTGAGGPATYVQNIRRSRGYSVSAANARPPSGATAGRVPSLYRESSLSVETSDTRRNKFRSDPFDLDRPELLAQSPGSSTRGVAGSSSNSSSGRYSGNASAQGLPNMPRPTHARGESFTSKYSSGVSSMGDWSDPGPDVGPAAGRWDTPSPDGALGRQPPLNTTGLERGRGGGSQRSVGKAI